MSVDSAGAEGDDDSFFNVAVSTGGDVIVFSSRASNLVAGDTNQHQDVFIHDRVSGTTERVSVDSSGAEGNGDSGWFAGGISADGRIVVFSSIAGNLVSGDTNGFNDIFVHDRSTGITERISVDSSGVEANWDSYSPSLSADGQVVAFTSRATNLVAGDTNKNSDIFVHDRTTGITERVSVSSSGGEGNDNSDASSISGDGRVVAFASSARNLVSGDTNHSADVFVHDRSTGGTERVSVNSLGIQGNWHSNAASISGDGERVAFTSYASNLVPKDNNGTWDVFVHDRASGTTERVSVDSSGGESNAYSSLASISADGRMVAFASNSSNLVSGDNNGCWDVFIHDRSLGTTDLVSGDPAGGIGDGNSGDNGYGLAISPDGGTVAFESVATNLVSSDTNGFQDVFVWGCRALATWSNYGSGFPGTNGVPSFTSAQNPVVGTTITLTLDNSSGVPTAGLIFVGFSAIDLPTSWGGNLLVLPALTIPITFSYGFDSFTGSLPNDWSFCGTTVDLQAIEADPGAAKGVSFTEGLELDLGH